jgi:hypothetical protein
MDKPVCRNCSNPAHAVNRPRGLCWRCFYTPGVKEAFGYFARTGSVHSVRGALRTPTLRVNHNIGRPVAPAPTTAVPGTPEKIEVMRLRAEARYAVLHPADAKYAGDPRPLVFLSCM